MADDFFSFEEALDELRLKEEELKRLVSEGEIRAFRDGETMKLRRSDVESLRSELSGGEVVDLGDASEELVFEDDTDLDAGMATEEISSADTILEADVEDVGEVELEEEDDFDEPAPAAAPARRRSAPAAMAAGLGCNAVAECLSHPSTTENRGGAGRDAPDGGGGQGPDSCR